MRPLLPIFALSATVLLGACASNDPQPRRTGPLPSPFDPPTVILIPPKTEPAKPAPQAMICEDRKGNEIPCPSQLPAPRRR